MAQIASFKDLIESLFYNEIYEELSNFIEENPDRIECSTYFVKSPDEAELYDYRVNAIDIIPSEGNEIIFDLIVAAEVKIAETVKRDRRTDETEQWFIISCNAELNNGINNFNIKRVAVYNNDRSNLKLRSSESLIPIIKKEELDFVAEVFLKKYFPEALEKPMKVLPQIIVERMGLELLEMNITKSSKAFGQIVFDDC
ncbi:MAG: hypothetical protein SNJ70_10670 [Armatimonadota bacterium]